MYGQGKEKRRTLFVEHGQITNFGIQANTNRFAILQGLRFES
jgi:hypothetical protein